MPAKKRPARPTNTRPSAGGPRRLGNQTTATRPASAGAQRRAARSRGSRSSKLGWLSVLAVVIIIAVFLVVHATSSSNNKNSSAGQSSGDNPSLAPASIVYPVTHVPAVVFNQVGTNNQPVAFELTSVKKANTENGLDRFIYFGAEYCPFCALQRWSLVAALSRFGTFSGLKETRSAITDSNVPTFSFLGSKYTSKYLVFSPYEYEDRNRNPLQTPPKAVENIVSKYDFPPYTTTANEGGIPFLSVGNVYIAGGDSQALSNLVVNGTLVNGGPGVQAIADAIQSPLSTTGKAVGGPIFIAQANYISAAICLTNGEQPTSVCGSSGVKAASKLLSSETPTK